MSDISVLFNILLMLFFVKNIMKMGKSKNKGMMLMCGKLCMGMMCKMMMKNSLMMGILFE